MKAATVTAAVTAALTLATGLLGSPASAEPAQPQPQPSGQNPFDNRPECKGVALDPVHPQYAFCVPWADNNKDRTVVCDRASDEADRMRCTAVTVPLQPDPKKAERSILSWGAPGTKIDCRQFDEANWLKLVGRTTSLNDTERKQLRARQSNCTGHKGFLEGRAVELGSTEPKAEKPVECGVADVSCKVKQGVANGVRSGIQGLVDMAVQAMVWLLGLLAKWVFTATKPPIATDAFYSVYNSVSGVLIICVFLFFLISTIINGMRLNGPGPVSSLGGLVRAMLGMTFAGGIAWLLVEAWDGATNALITKQSTTPWDPGAWTKAVTTLSSGNGTMFIALLVAIFAVIGLILTFIQMLFRSVLIAASALFGAMAMAGQVMPETRSWGRKWFWSVNALAASKFFIAALWFYGGRLLYNANDLMTALQALLIIWMMVLAPAVLMRLTSMFDAYISDVNAKGMVSSMASGAGIGSALGNFGGGGSGSGDGGSSDNAASTMNANSSSIPTNPTGNDPDSGGSRGDGGGLPGAAQTGEDGGKVGDTSGIGPDDPNNPNTGADDGGSGSGGNGPNAEEANGIQVGTDAAKQSLSGHPTLPTESGGQGAGGTGSAPGMPTPGGSVGGPAGGGAGGAGKAAGEVPPVV